jgi:hypothetical protein
VVFVLTLYFKGGYVNNIGKKSFYQRKTYNNAPYERNLDVYNVYWLDKVL